MRPTPPRRLPAATLLLVFVVLLSFAARSPARTVGAAAADAPAPRAFWLDLPRARPGDPEPRDLPYPPVPTAQALRRRDLRGDARRIEELSRGPDPAALRSVLPYASHVRHVSRWLSAVSLELTPGAQAALRARFGAAALRPVARLRARLPKELPVTARPQLAGASVAGLDYGLAAAQLTQIQIDRLHAAGLSGRGVTVLVLDTGFRIAHEAFTRLDVRAQYDFVFNDGQTADEAADVPGQHNHGTGVLAVVAGDALGELIGPAYGASVLLAKTEYVPAEVRSEEDHFVAGLEWGEALGADVATASLSYSAFDDSTGYTPSQLDGNTGKTTRAMDAAVALGVVSICAMGNAGPGATSLGTPADGDSVLSIGAVDVDGAIANFSSRGPTADGRIKPDLCARGVTTRWARAAGGYGDASGTSLATPLAAGAAALLLEAHPEWNPVQVGSALRATATQHASPDNTLGWGILQAYDACFTVAAPQWPLPFSLLAPADSAHGAGGPETFRWHIAVDLQTQSAVTYTVHAASSLAFADTLALWPAGTDTARAIAAFPGPTIAWRVLAQDPQGHVRSSDGFVFHPATGTAVREAALRLDAGWVVWDVPRGLALHAELQWRAAGPAGWQLLRELRGEALLLGRESLPDGAVAIRLLSQGVELARLDVAAPLLPWATLAVPRPNPFNPAVVLALTLRRPARVELRVVDAAGRTVCTLSDGALWAAGEHALRWDGRDARGADAASGVYYAHFRADDGRTSAGGAQRMVLVR
jgi:subtilisin family serine protease